MANTAAPVLSTKEITDTYIQKNFDLLNQTFQSQNQLQDFKFFEQVFTKGQANIKIAHGLKYVPQDIIVTHITGNGSITFNSGLFDTTYLDVTVTDACRVRFFVGSYWNNTPTANDAKTVGMQYQGVAVVPPTTSTTSTSSTSTTTTTSSIPGVSAATAQAITAAIAAAVPPGLVLDWTSSSAPTGWLLCNGATYSASQYPNLYARIGRTFSSSSVATGSFQVPNTQGIFRRGVGSQTISGRTHTSAALGITSSDTTAQNGMSLHDPGHNHLLQQACYMKYTGGSSDVVVFGGPGMGYTNAYANGNTTGCYVGSTDAETAPASMAFYQIIKT